MDVMDTVTIESSTMHSGEGMNSDSACIQSIIIAMVSRLHCWAFKTLSLRDNFVALQFLYADTVIRTHARFSWKANGRNFDPTDSSFYTYHEAMSISQFLARSRIGCKVVSAGCCDAPCCWLSSSPMVMMSVIRVMVLVKGESEKREEQAKKV
jgi:hypothetical protein